MEKGAETDFQTVFRTLDLTQGQILRALLRAERIPAVLADEHTVQTQQLWGPAMGGVQIRVPAEHAEEARTLIAAFQSGALALPDEN